HFLIYNSPAWLINSDHVSYTQFRSRRGQRSLSRGESRDFDYFWHS
ncbi:unnamed protein product, partial [Arabidopsis halleri]